MNWQEYVDAVRENAQAFMAEHYQHATNYADVHDAMMERDEVTGAEGMSYTKDYAQAEENIQGICDDDEVLEKFQNLGYLGFPDDAELVDVTARQIALDELYEELEVWFYER